MNYVWLSCWLAGTLLFAGTEASELNVNTRYTVESVVVTGDGWSTDPASDHNRKLSSGLRSDLLALIGEKLNPAALDDLAARVKKELNARAVSHRVLRGDNPEQVRVVFDVKPQILGVDLTAPQALYQSKEGWSGELDAGIRVEGKAFVFGVVSDGDTLAERKAGILARFQNDHLGTNRVGLRFQFESYHDQWNGATVQATPELYRTRQNFTPEATFVIARPLTISVGAFIAANLSSALNATAACSCTRYMSSEMSPAARGCMISLMISGAGTT